MAVVNCNQFEAMLSDYLGHALEPRDSKRLAEHALQCRSCRALLDDVKARLADSLQAGEVQTSESLEELLVKIPSEHGALSCSGFEEMITEFLDGFLPAPAYHRFATHSAQCNDCSNLLTDVVFAIAAAHSVHVYEEVEVPEALLAGLQAIAEGGQRRHALARLRSLLKYASPRAWPRIAAAVAIGLATVLSGAFGFGHMTPAAILHKVRLKAASLCSGAIELGSKKQEITSRVEVVGSSFSLVWQSLGGAGKTGSGTGDAGGRRQGTEGHKRDEKQSQRSDSDVKGD
jgi:hypothetical protein